MRSGRLLITFLLLLSFALMLESDTSSLRVFTYEAGRFVAVPHAAPVLSSKTPTHPCFSLSLPEPWDVRDGHHADLTGDGERECVLLVWRPWRDWPIMRWSETESPIEAHRDERGESAHVILAVPDAEHGYRELWAGSALASPLLHLRVGDVDGDGQQELVALEGTYAAGRRDAARYVTVWRWNGFGFTLDWRSAPGRYHTLQLVDVDDDAVLDLVIR